MRAEIDRRAMALLSTAHMATDFANGALPALIPFLKDRFSLSYTLVGVLILASQASSSLIQPLFGLWSDRRGALWMLPGGVVLAGVGIALAADAPRYWLVVVLVLVSGIGVAAFHPEGSKFAGYVSGRRRASGMAWFSIGGNLGFAAGPVVATFLVHEYGLRGGLLLAAPGLAIAAVSLALVGACVVGTFGVTMVMSQEYLPRHIGMASGLSIGMSVGLGGIAAVGLGSLADATSLRTALYLAAATPLLAIALAAMLPSSRRGHVLEPELVVP